jgi:hypothetical protein
MFPAHQPPSYHPPGATSNGRRNCEEYPVAGGGTSEHAQKRRRVGARVSDHSQNTPFDDGSYINSMTPKHYDHKVLLMSEQQRAPVTPPGNSNGLLRSPPATQRGGISFSNGIPPSISDIPESFIRSNSPVSSSLFLTNRTHVVTMVSFVIH